MLTVSQQDKISKLVEIWERGNTFPLNMLNDFKTLLQARAKTGMRLSDHSKCKLTVFSSNRTTYASSYRYKCRTGSACTI